VPKSRNVPPAVGAARGRLAAKKRFHPDQDHSEIERDLAVAKIADYIERELAKAGPLSEQQCSNLAELLKPARDAITVTRLAELDSAS
jgi:hypothetical protein